MNKQGLGMAVGGALLGIGGAAALYAGLAFASSLTSDQKSLIGAGVGLVGGVGLGYVSPLLGVGFAAGIAGTAAAAYANEQVAAYEANQSTTPTTPAQPATTPATTGSGINDRFMGSRIGASNTRYNGQPLSIR
jgi:hypothetical protein